MPDLVVDTGALRAAAGALANVAAIAEALAAKHGRAASLVPAIGYPQPTLAADSFVSEWTYGAGWIASHARHSGAYLTTTAQTYEAIEALLAAAAGSSAAAATSSPPFLPPVDEPVRPALRGTPGLNLVPASLGTARSVRELIPGEPDLVETLGRRLVGFADDLADARTALMRISLGTWIGASAEACAADLEELSARVRAAELAFYEAGDAVSAYAPVHADVQAQAARALALWQAAAPAAAILRGTAVGTLPAGAPADPEADLVRADAMFQDARETMAVAAKALTERLEDAQRGAPNDPGWFSKIRRAVESFAVGTVEGVVGMGEGVGAIAKLMYQLDPLRGFYDPQGYREAQDALWAAVAHAGSHPKEVGAALIDLDTWKDDPFKAAGKLVPDLMAILATAGAEGAVRGAEATAQLRGAWEAVEQARMSGRSFDLGAGLVNRRLAELGLDPSSVVGRAAAAQARAPWMNVDEWTPTIFEPGHRFAVARSNDIGVAVTDYLGYDARHFFEGQQMPPFRPEAVESNSAPLHFDSVYVLEVRARIEGASAHAMANAQFGEGGATLEYIPDFDRAIDSGQVVWVREHHFSPSTLDSRIEDPRFRMVDPSLPSRALDPAEQQLRGVLHGGAEEAGISARQTAMTVGAAGASDHIDRGAR
jgi:hypothetical protein